MKRLMSDGEHKTIIGPDEAKHLWAGKNRLHFYPQQKNHH